MFARFVNLMFAHCWKITQKCLIWIFQLWYIPPFKSLTCLVTLYVRPEGSVFQNSPNWPFLAFFSDFHTPWFASKREYFSWILLFLELVESTVFRRAYLSKYLHKKYTRWQKWPLRTKVSDWKKAVASARHCTTSALFFCLKQPWEEPIHYPWR